MIRIFTRQIETLRSEDGQALVFVALVGLVLFLFLAMTMNVAELVNTKIKNQNVADATALSAAVWEARVLNLVSATNRNMLELWAAAIAAAQGCIVSGAICELSVCGPVWVDPLFCLGCLVITGVTCEFAVAFFHGAVTTGVFQDMILDAIDRNVVDPDLLDVVDLNYSFKPNTASDDVGVYVYYPSPGEDLLKTYVHGDAESGDTVLERVGVCAMMVIAARYVNYWWHETDGTTGLSDADWDTLLPTIYGWYSPGGPCFQDMVGPDDLDPAFAPMFPLALRTRISDWSAQNVDALLAITVATYKAQEPPPALGKGSDATDCTWEPNDTRFACPNGRHYAFASAHAYSESVSEFYNTQMAGLATSHLIPYIPFEMDWEARLFPLEPYPGGAESPQAGWVAYEDIANQVQDDGFVSDYQLLYDNVLMLNGMHFFLY
jgi:hypothetical protein